MMNTISNTLLDEGRTYAEKIIEGLSAATSHFHGVKYMKDKLLENNFTEIFEQEKWDLTPG